MANRKSLHPSPKWLYRFLDWVDRTPGKGALWALVVYLASAGFTHAAAWWAGNLPHFELDANLLFAASWFPSNVLVWLWIDRVARSAIQDFAKGIGKSNAETTRIETDFVSLSPIVAALLAGFGAVISYVDAANQAAAAGIAQWAAIFIFSLPAMLGGAIELLTTFRLGRQLILVNRLYNEVKDVNLFSLWPIYALSRYGYTLALFFILLTVTFDLILILITGNGFGLAIIAYTLIISIVVFLAPLFGISARLRREKEQDLQRLGVQLDQVFRETEAAVRRRQLGKVPALKTAASALKEQIEAVQKVATWPWNPGSLRNLLLPVLLPLVIAVVQRYVLSFLGFQ
jgi:hypothetical protein